MAKELELCNLPLFLGLWALANTQVLSSCLVGAFVSAEKITRLTTCTHATFMFSPVPFLVVMWQSISLWHFPSFASFASVMVVAYKYYILANLTWLVYWSKSRLLLTKCIQNMYYTPSQNRDPVLGKQPAPIWMVWQIAAEEYHIVQTLQQNWT